MSLEWPEAGRSFLPAVAVFGVLAALLAFGPTIRLAGADVPGPFRVLQALPGFAQTRVPSRFVHFARLSLAVLAGAGLVVVARRAGRRGRWIAGGLILLAPIEHLSIPLPHWRASSGESIPEVYRWLATVPERGPAVEFPPHPVRLRRGEAFWQRFSTYHWLPLVNGFSSYYPVHYDFLYDQMLELPTQPTLDLLHALGVRYLIFHPAPPGHPEGDRAVARFERRLPAYADQIVPIAAFSDAGVRYPEPLRNLGGERVYRLVPRRTPAEPACSLAGLPRVPREGWRCEGNPAENDCRLALDGRTETAFHTTDTQVEGQFIRVVFPRAQAVRAVSLVSGSRSAFYPRAVEIRVLREGSWQTVEAAFDGVAFLRAMLDDPETAALDLCIPPSVADGVEVRLARVRHPFNPWLLPELELYAPR